MTITTCPHCTRELFRTGLVPPNLAVKVSGPDTDEDEDGHFMKCPHCGKRVDLDPSSTTPGAGGTLRVRR